MKLKLPPTYVPFGPVGHPNARPFVYLMGTDKSDVQGSLYSHLERYSRQGKAPSMFFDEYLSLEAQGYYVVPVVNGNEIDDAVLAGLKPCELYVPAAPGKPGRTLSSVRTLLPSFLKLEDLEVWGGGANDTPCNHDFGLESYAVVLKEDHTNKLYSEADVSEILDSDTALPEGTYYSTFRCTRCSELHAIPQR